MFPDFNVPAALTALVYTAACAVPVWVLLELLCGSDGPRNYRRRK